MNPVFEALDPELKERIIDTLYDYETSELVEMICESMSEDDAASWKEIFDEIQQDIDEDEVPLFARQP
jgi:hypothetical protein